MRRWSPTATHHRHQLHSLTGLVAEEHQATQILNEVRELRATLSRELGVALPLSVAAMRWRDQRFDRRCAGSVRCPEPRRTWSSCTVRYSNTSGTCRAGTQDVGFEHTVDDFVRRFRRRPPEPDVKHAVTPDTLRHP